MGGTESKLDDRENTQYEPEKENALEAEADDLVDRVDEDLWERFCNDPNFLRTVTMRELYSNVYQGRPYLIDGLLRMGTYLFVGAPKVGKSFFILYFLTVCHSKSYMPKYCGNLAFFP